MRRATTSDKLPLWRTRISSGDVPRRTSIVKDGLVRTYTSASPSRPERRAPGRGMQEIDVVWLLISSPPDVSSICAPYPSVAQNPVKGVGSTGVPAPAGERGGGDAQATTTQSGARRKRGESI